MSSYRESAAGYLGYMGNINIYAHTRFCTCCSLAQHPNHLSFCPVSQGTTFFPLKAIMSFKCSCHALRLL